MPDFAHPSERHVAALLTSYGIRWEYEPTTFVLSRDARGRPTCAFTPDFHLVDFGVFLEITTVRQPHATRKHRKIRLLAETHPEVQVMLLNRRDLEGLAAKYGLDRAAA